MNKGEPSRTARKVGLNIVTLGSVPEMSDVLPAGIVDATARLLVASGSMSERAVAWFKSPRMVSIYQSFDWLLPGQFEAFAYRKAFCEQQVRDGIANGATQVLVLGAGYDTLAWRLSPEFKHVNFFEIDEPATANLKAKGIEQMGQRANQHLIAKDLGQTRLVEVLNDKDAWNPAAPTVILAEGLLMYLPAQAVRDLFVQCNAVTGKGSRIAFSYVPTGEDGRPDAGPRTGLVLWMLKVGGEPWLWSIRPNELATFLEEAGWTHAPELLSSEKMKGLELYAVAVKATV